MMKKQVKVTVEPEIAKTFKDSCKASGVSMSLELARFMTERGKLLAHTAKKKQRQLDTREGRRKEFAKLILRLEEIRDSEDEYKNRIPINLQNGPAYASAENTVDLLEQAIELLYEVFN